MEGKSTGTLTEMSNRNAELQEKATQTYADLPIHGDIPDQMSLTTGNQIIISYVLIFFFL